MKLRSMDELRNDEIGLVYVYDQYGRRYAPCYKRNGYLLTVNDETLDPEKCLGWVPYMPQGIADKIPTSSESRRARQRVGEVIARLSIATALIMGMVITAEAGYGLLDFWLITLGHALNLSVLITGCWLVLREEGE